MSASRFLKSERAKYALIGAIAVCSCILLYLVGALFIETAMLVAYAASFPAILIYEKTKQRGSSSNSLSEDERWSRAKSKLEKIDDRIRKARDRNEKQSLLNQKLNLQSELRRLEWEIRESDMNQLYNATKGNMKRLADASSKTEEPELSSEKQNEKLSDRQALSKIVKNAQYVMQHEPRISLRIALKPIENDLRLHYGVLKMRKEQKGSTNAVLSNYWVTWVALSSVSKGIRVEQSLAKYASEDYRPKFRKFLEFIEKLEPSGSKVFDPPKEPEAENSGAKSQETNEEDLGRKDTNARRIVP